MILTEQANELIKKLHEEMNATGKYNTYVITEDVESGNIHMNVHTVDRKLSEEEEKSFSQLLDKIKPYITKRTKDFKEKAKPTGQAPIKSLHIDKLIGQLVVVNISSADSKSSNLSPEYLAEQVKKALVSALSESLVETCTDKGTSQKEHPCNIPQS